MTTKIKHSAITAQNDLHEPKHHTDRHKRLGVDPIVIEDAFTNEASDRKVLQKGADVNSVAWTDALKVATLDATGDLITSAGNITATAGNILTSAGNITATNGDIEMSATDHKLFVGANGTDGTYSLGRYNTSNENYPLITKRVSGAYSGRPSYFNSQNFSFKGAFDAHTDQVNYSTGDYGALVNGRPKFGSNNVTISSGTATIGTTISGITTAEIIKGDYFTTAVDSYITSVTLSGFQIDANTGTVDVVVLEKTGVASGGACLVRMLMNPIAVDDGVGNLHITDLSANSYVVTDFDNNTNLSKVKVSRGNPIFIIAKASANNLKMSFEVQVELIPCN